MDFNNGTLKDKYDLFFPHLGIAVRKTNMTLQFLDGLGYIIDEKVYDEIQNVNLIFLQTHYFSEY